MFLKPMTDFVLHVLDQKPPFDTAMMLIKIGNYADLFKEKPKLGMFVPCDENGNFLEYPIDGMKIGKHSANYDVYKKAEDKVLFKGFNLSEKKISVQSFREDGTLKRQIPIKAILNFETVEDMVNNFINPLELTEEAAKKYYNHD